MPDKYPQIEFNTGSTTSLNDLRNIANIQSDIASKQAFEPVNYSSEYLEDKGDNFIGLSRDKIEDSSFLQSYRANNQPWYEQVGNMLNQAVLGEVVGGTLMSIGALYDPLARMSGTSEDKFHNFIYELGNDISKWTQEETPIYRDPNKRFSDPAWWFQNGVSLTSSLSMLLPSLGVAKGLQWLTKASGLLKLGTSGVVASDMISTLGGSIAGRHAENFREASGVFDDLIKVSENSAEQWYQKEINTKRNAIELSMQQELSQLPSINVSPEHPLYQQLALDRYAQEQNIKNKYAAELESQEKQLAEQREIKKLKGHQIASEQASADYTANYANLVFDVIQLGAIMKPFKGLTRGIGNTAKVLAADELVSGVSRSATSKAGKIMQKVRDYDLLAQSTEGVEEVVNTISQKETERQGRIEMGVDNDDGSTFGDRLINEHLGSADTWDSFMWGIAGGVAFNAVGRAIEGTSKQEKNKLEEIASRKEKLTQYIDAINKAEESGDDFKANNLSKQLQYDIAWRAASSGNVDLLLEHIDSPQFLKDMKDSGMSDEKAGLKIKELKDNIGFVEEQYKNMYAELRTDPKAFNYLLGQKINEREAGNLKNELNVKINELKSKIASNNSIDGIPTDMQLLTEQIIKLQSLEQAINNEKAKANEIAKEEGFYVDKKGFYRAEKQTQKNKKREIEFNTNAYEIEKRIEDLTIQQKQSQKILDDTLKQYSELNNISQEQGLKALQDKVNNFGELHNDLIKAQAYQLGAIEREKTAKENINRFKKDKSFRENELKVYEDEAKEQLSKQKEVELNNFKKTIDENNNIDELNKSFAKEQDPGKKQIIKDKLESLNNTQAKQEKNTKEQQKSQATQTKTTGNERYYIDSTPDPNTGDVVHKIYDSETNNIVGGNINFDKAKAQLDELNNTSKVENNTQTEENNSAGYGTIAADYLLTGGKDVIGSTDYFLQALMGCFIHSSKEINKIRNKYINKLGNIKDDINTNLYQEIISEIKKEINKSYSNNFEINEILNKILEYPTGLPVKLGNELSIKLDKLNESFSNINKEENIDMSNYEGLEFTEGEIIDVVPETTSDSEDIITEADKKEIDIFNKETNKKLNGDGEILTGKKAGNQVTLGYLSTDYILENGVFIDNYDENGRLKASNDADRSMLVGNKYSGGKTINIFVDKSNSLYTGKNSVENLPIAIQLEEDNGKPINTWLHEKSWYYDANGKLADGVKQETVDSVMAIRSILFNNQEGSLKTTLKGSTPGKINKLKKGFFGGMHETFNKSGVFFGFRNRMGEFETNNNKSVLNPINRNPSTKGMAFVFVPTAIDKYLGTYLKQSPIKELESKQKTIDILSGLIYNWVNNRSTLEKLGITKVSDLYDEIEKHIYLTTGKTDSLSLDNRTFFKFYDNNDSTGAVLEVIENGKVKRLELDTLNKKKTPVTLNELTKLIEGTFEYGKFPNITKLGAFDYDNTFSYIDVNDKGELFNNTEGNYLQFLDKFEYAKTDVQMIEDKNGNKTFISQPVIAINTDSIIKKETDNKIEVKSEDNTTEVSKDIEYKVPNESQPAKKKYKTNKSFFDDGNERSLLNLNNASLSSFKSNLSFFEQMQITNQLVSLALDGLEQQRTALTEEDKPFEEFAKDAIIPTSEVMGYIKSNLEDFKEANPAFSKQIDHVLDNFEQKMSADGKIEFVGYEFLILNGIEQLKFKVSMNEEIEAQEGNNEKKSHADNRNDRTDPEQSMSGKTKRILANIPEIKIIKQTNENGVVEEIQRAIKSPIGITARRPYYEIFNFLAETLADTPIGLMKDKLNLHIAFGGNNGILAKQILDKVNALPQNEQNAFYSTFAMTQKDFKLIAFDKKNEGKPLFKIIQSNQNTAGDLLLSKWKADLQANNPSLIEKINEDGTIVYNKEKVKEIIKKADDWVRLGERANIADYAKILNEIGIMISPKALVSYAKSLRHQHYKLYKKDSNARKDDSGNISLTWILNQTTGHIISALGDKNKDIFKNEMNLILPLAIMENKHNPTLLSNSYRNANGDMIYGIVPGSYISDQMYNILNDENYRNALLNTKFAQASRYLQELNANGNKDNAFHLYYLDALKDQKQKDSVTTYEEMSPFNKEVTNINLFANGNSKHAIFMTVAPSDKTTFSLIQTTKLSLEGISFNGHSIVFAENSVALNQFKKYALAEIERANETIEQYHSFKETPIDLIEHYHYTKIKGSNEIVLGAGSSLMLFPGLIEYLDNNHLILSKENKETGDHKGHIIVSEKTEQVINEYLKDFLIDMIHNKVMNWLQLGIVELDNNGKIKHLNIDSNYTNNQSNKFNKSNTFEYLNKMATDYMLNKLEFYINDYAIFEGDPAFFYNGKAKENTWESIMDATANNLYKRTAKTIAPGRKGLWDTKVANYLMINEPQIHSNISEVEGLNQSNKDYYKKLLDVSDAQEWVSAQEYIRQLYAYGTITQQQYNDLMDNIENMTPEQLDIVFQPVKPVYVYSQIDEKLNINVPYYIKTSAMPLIPQMLRGTNTHLEKMMDFMTKNNIDRIVPKSAVKTGFRKAVTLFNDKGEFTTPDDVKPNIQQLSRDGYRIQQDVPYDLEHDHSTWGSQFAKLRFADILPSIRFQLNNKEEGYSAKELKAIDDKIHNIFYQRRWNALVKELGFEDNNGEYTLKDMNTLKNMLIDEATKTGKLSDNDLLMLNTIEVNGNYMFDIPLLFQNMSDKIESLMQSLVKNRVLKFNLPGKSYVQGSSLGMSFTKEKIDKSGNTKNRGIVWSKDHKGENLDYKIDENGGVYAEVVIAPYFLTKDKKAIDIAKYITSDGFINTDKIDPELLNMVGYRIPTQGHNSMIRLKIVGFLPQNSGDLILVPAAVTGQMGSDFDVDKLYIHNYNYYFNEDNHIKKLSTSKIDVNKLEDLTNEELENTMLDISHSILSNKEMVNKIMSPLTSDPLSKVIDDLDAITPEQDKTQFYRSAFKESGLINPDYQSYVVDSNAAGKIGIGTWSVVSVNHVAFQYAGLYLKYTIDKETKKPIESSGIAVKFTDNKGNLFNDTLDMTGNSVNNNTTYEDHVNEGAWRLDKLNTFDSNKLISEVISYIQSASVDVAKEQQLNKLNLNKETFNVAALIAETGFDERYIGAFLRQPLIMDYIKMLSSLDKITEQEFNKDKVKKATTKFLKNYLGEFGSKESNYEDITPITAVSLEQMHKNIKEHYKDGVENTSMEYKVMQANMLVNFLKYNEIAIELLSLKSSMNTDTKLLEKTIASSIEKSYKLTKNLKGDGRIGNVSNLDKDTRQSGANDVLYKSIELFTNTNLFPIDNLLLKQVKDSIQQELKKDELNEKHIVAITDAYKSAIYSKVIADLFNETDIPALRDSLLRGKHSLAKDIVEYRLKNPNNLLLNSLKITLADEKNASFVEYMSAKDIKDLFNFGNPISWMELLNAPEGSMERSIGERMIQYALVFGNDRNARDFGRFIPSDYLLNNNIGQLLRNFLVDVDTDSLQFATTGELSKRIVKQWFQHNPYKATKIDSFDSFRDVKDADNKYNKVSPDTFTIPLDTNNPFINDLAFNNEMPRFITYHNTKEHVWMLYEKTKTVSGGALYQRINLLGGNLLTEYDLTNDNVNSVVSISNINNVKLDDKISDLEVATNIPITPTIDKLNNDSISRRYKFNDGMEAVLTHLTQQGSSEDIKRVANFYLTKLGYIADVKFTETQNKDFYFNGVINIDPSINTDYNNSRIANGLDINNSEDLEKIILHEISHALLESKLKNPVTEQDKAIVQAIQQVFNSAKNNAEIQSAIDKHNASKGLKTSIYNSAFTDIHEFTSVLMSDKNFARILNDVKYDKTNKTFLEKILQLFKNLLSFEVKSDSHLASALDGIMQLTNNVEQEEINGTINIYAGTKENVVLSNFANRPFITSINSLQFNTVEGAYQAMKLAYTNNNFYKKEIKDYSEKDKEILNMLQKATGSQAKNIGRNITGLNIKEWDKDSSKIMKQLIFESFKQNSYSLEKLLETGNTTLTHIQDKTKWGKEFPKLLMEVRNELRNNNITEINTNISEQQNNNKFLQELHGEYYTPKRSYSTLKGIKEKLSFRGIPIQFVDVIPTKKDTPVGMRMGKDGILRIDEKTFKQKYEDKAWTNPAQQKDGTKAEALPSDEFKSFEEFLTFALIHEYTHTKIKREEGELTGPYETRINNASLQDLNKYYREDDASNGTVIESFLLGPNGKSVKVADYMKSLTPEQREGLRKLMDSKEIIFKC